jgi:hypothetical protein
MCISEDMPKGMRLRALLSDARGEPSATSGFYAFARRARALRLVSTKSTSK